jgi:hypothetical protein
MRTVPFSALRHAKNGLGTYEFLGHKSVLRWDGERLKQPGAIVMIKTLRYIQQVL